MRLPIPSHNNWIMTSELQMICSWMQGLVWSKMQFQDEKEKLYIQNLESMSRPRSLKYKALGIADFISKASLSDCFHFKWSSYNFQPIKKERKSWMRSSLTFVVLPQPSCSIYFFYHKGLLSWHSHSVVQLEKSHLMLPLELKLSRK